MGRLECSLWMEGTEDMHIVPVFAHSHAPSSHQTSLAKLKVKDKSINNFDMVRAGY